MDLIQLIQENSNMASLIAIVALWKHTSSLHKACEEDRRKLWEQIELQQKALDEN